MSDPAISIAPPEAPRAPIAAPGRALPKWAQLALTREPGTALALFRAGTGASVLVSLLTVMAHHDVAAFWLGPTHGGFTPPVLTSLFKLIGGVDPARLYAVLGVDLACGLLLLLGLGGRVPALIAVLTYPSLVGLNPDAGGSYDVLVPNALWLLVLGNGTATLSLDCWLRTRRWTSDRQVFAWPRWLALYQLVLVYFSTGIQKVSDTWVPGGRLSAIYYVMQQPTWHRGPMVWLAHVFPLTQLATLGTWCFEVGSPLLLIAILLENRGRGRVAKVLARVPFRRAFAAFGIALHAGIAATLVLGCFSLQMCSFYAALIRPRK